MTEVSSSSRPENPYARRYAVFGILFGLAFPVIATAVGLAYARLPWSFGSIVAIQSQPLMWIIDTAPAFLGALAAMAGRRQDALEDANLILNRQARQLRGDQLVLEKRVADRTQELEERDRQMHSAVRISRDFTQIRDVPELTATAVRLIAQNLTDFIVDLYLIDERRSEAVRAASSEGENAPPSSVRVGDPGILGQVAASGEAGRALSGPAGPELGLPLLARGRPLGVLHLRAARNRAQLPPDTEVLQLLADQLAAAIETSRLFSQARDALQQLQTVKGASTGSAWKGTAAQSAMAYEFTPAGVRAAQVGADSADPGSLRIPLELRGERIGTIALTRRSTENWTETDRDLAQKTADQVALALENVRLLEETRERALQEQTLSEFSARLSQSVDLDTLLQTAVRELATLPDVADASIYLNPSVRPSESGMS